MIYQISFGFNVFMGVNTAQEHNSFFFSIIGRNTILELGINHNKEMQHRNKSFTLNL